MNIVLITGATSGIGKACVEKFSKERYFIIGIGKDKKKLKKLKSQSIKFGSLGFKGIQCNFDNIKSINKMINKLRNFKKIDCIVNSAGVAYKNNIKNLSLKEWNNVMQVNVTIPFLIVQKSLNKLLKSKNPSIVNISSIAGRTRSISLGCHYTTSKSAIIGMTRHLASELGPKGIRVNCSAPSQTLTPMLKKALSKKDQILLSKKVPLKRLAEAREQAEVIYFLCSNKSSYVNGAIVDVNGGLF